MNLFLWMMAGAVVGWLAFAVLSFNETRGTWISALIGAIGGVVGGKVVAPVLVSAPLVPTDFSMAALLFATALAAVAVAAGNFVENRWGV
jgi:uncharacterized membrane protein YeaQ/YmgE (transglycosylase-associated protein family)